MSKEKTREIKVWMSEIDLSELEERGIAVVRTDKTKMSHHILGASLSVPEKTVTISESTFYQIVRDVLIENESVPVSERKVVNEWHRALFGGET